MGHGRPQFRCTMAGNKVRELPTDKELEAMDTAGGGGIVGGGKKAVARPQDDVPSGNDDDPFKDTKGKTIGDREDEYRAQRTERPLSPDRADPFAASTPAPELSTYKDVMVGQQLDKEKKEVLQKIQKQKEEELLSKGETKADAPKEKKARRWD